VALLGALRNLLDKDGALVTVIFGDFGRSCAATTTDTTVIIAARLTGRATAVIAAIITTR